MNVGGTYVTWPDAIQAMKIPEVVSGIVVVGALTLYNVMCYLKVTQMNMDSSLT